MLTLEDSIFSASSCKGKVRKVLEGEGVVVFVFVWCAFFGREWGGWEVPRMLNADSDVTLVCLKCGDKSYAMAWV